MKKWKIACAVLAALLGVTVVFAATAAAGGREDPLITLSYLDRIFRPQVEQMAEDAVSAHKSELQDALNDAIDQRTGAASFRVVTLSRGQTLTGNVGCEIMLRVGAASCVASEDPGLIDSTAGSTLNNGDALVTNHLYLVTIDTRSVTAASGTVKLLVRGPYSVG